MISVLPHIRERAAPAVAQGGCFFRAHALDTDSQTRRALLALSSPRKLTRSRLNSVVTCGEAAVAAPAPTRMQWQLPSPPQPPEALADSSGEREVWPGVLEGWWKWEGHHVRYLHSGISGPALVCMHGFGANADHWRRNLGPLGKAGCVAYAIDLLGYGYSSKPDPCGLPPNTIYNFATWSRQLRDFIRERVGRPTVVVCNSAGGEVGLQAAIDEPSLIKAVQVFDISLRKQHISKQALWQRPLMAAVQNVLHNTQLGSSYFKQLATKECVRSLLRQCYGDKAAVSEELVEAILKPALQPGASAVFLDTICLSSGPLPEEQLQAVKVPVSIVWGGADPWEKVEEGRQLAKYPAVEEFITLPGIGHSPQDEAPELVHPLILSFVQRHD